MAPLTNGYTNGNTHALTSDASAGDVRFSDIPSAIDIPVSGGQDAEEAVEVNLEELLDDPTELCTLLENEGAARNFWMVISLAYAKQRKVDHAIEMLIKGLGALSKGGPKEKLSLLSCLCWLYLWKSREAPRVVPEGQFVSEARTKDFYLQAATGSLNEASRINPSFPPLFLARGVLYLLRASLQPPSKPLAPGSADHSERVETLRQALKCFEDASRVSGGRNMMAILGRSRAQFSLGKFNEALDGYQEVLMKMPDLRDPDPRIGVGCCLWQLGYRDEARDAWDRALDINPESKIANILLGLYYLNESSHFATTDPAFAPIYKKAMTQYTQRAFKLDKELPLTCATFGGYFIPRKAWTTVENLARKAIELTDVNAIASDGWYLLARKEHYQEQPDLSKASDFYGRADNARGGGDKGYLPARFGSAQIQILLQDFDGAKFRLEKIIQHSKSLEAMILLGTLYAEDFFANQATGSKEDKSGEQKKAIALLEAVRMAWKDPKRNLTPDTAVLVCLSRLYEVDQPEKSLQCLQQVEQMAIDDIPDEDRPDDIDDGEVLTAKLREQLPPQLLNNIGCFQYQSEKYDVAKDMFQTALTACIRAGEKNEALDTDALVTTISYNLARTYEAAGLLDEAKQVYEGLLARHEDYTDARTRVAYIGLRQNPTEDGPKAMAALYETDSTNLEVRSLFGWYLSRSKKRTTNIAEDQEQRHYKHTLQHHDKHDRYSLTGMGNLYLITAREMRRDSEQDKEKRRKTYEKAVEFYDKALQLDPRNAYAAQGIAIALIEDKKDFKEALQIFSKIRDTLRDASVYINLGHTYAEIKQYSRSIESYEAALAKDRMNDPQILACLGRVWLMKGKQEHSIQAMKSSLDYSNRALEIAPDQIHFKFNIAFVQIQLASLVYSLPEPQRTLQEVQSASDGLDEAIESLTLIAQSKNPPYPKHDIEQRANMGRNTMRRQLERAIQSQKEYEEKNATKLQQAREVREAETRRREEERLKAAELALEQKKKIAQERHKMLEISRQLAEKRAEEERRKEEAEYTEDEETGERVKRKKKKGGAKRKKKGGEDSDSDGGDGVDVDAAAAAAAADGGRKARAKSTTDNSGIASSDEERAPKRRRKLATRKSAAREGGKIKSSEIVVDSDESGGEGEGDDADVRRANDGKEGGGGEGGQDALMEDADADEDEEAVRMPRGKGGRGRRIADDDDDDDEEEEEEEDERKGEGEGGVPPLTPEGGEEEGEEEEEVGGKEGVGVNGDGDGDGNGKGSVNVFADGEDEPMVDASVGAAGDEDTAEY